MTTSDDTTENERQSLGVSHDYYGEALYLWGGNWGDTIRRMSGAEVQDAE
jgi:hypothetical protein